MVVRKRIDCLVPMERTLYQIKRFAVALPAHSILVDSSARPRASTLTCRVGPLKDALIARHVVGQLEVDVEVLGFCGVDHVAGFSGVCHRKWVL